MGRAHAEPTNKDRAARIEPTLTAYLEALEGRPAMDLDMVDEDSVKDLLADLMHYCVREGIDFEDNLRVARNNFEEEVFDAQEVQP